jgi:hypothetical protein
VTIRAWLADRTPPPPPRLRERIEEAFGDALDCTAWEVPAHGVSAAETLLADLLARPTPGRASALDLLTVDALVTYAFEGAAAEPASLAARAEDAMTRLAALA